MAGFPPVHNRAVWDFYCAHNELHAVHLGEVACALNRFGSSYAHHCW